MIARLKVLLTLCICLCFTIFSNAQVPSFVPPNGLQGWWPLNGNAIDASPNTNHGAGVYTIPAPDRTQKVNSALFFPNSNSLIEIPDNPTLRVENSFSISLWVKIAGISQTLIRKGKTFGIDLGGSSNFSAGTNILFFINDTRSGLFTSAEPLPLNTWLHLTGVYDGKSTLFYVNGKIIAGQGSFSGSIVNDASPLSIGSWNQEVFNGTIDNVGLWNRGLTEVEVLNLFNDGCADFISDPLIPALIKMNSTVTLTVPNAMNDYSYQWQTNPYDLGWQNLKDNKIFTGVNNKDLTINKVSFQNHKQLFRLLTINGECNDISSTIELTIEDTCVNILNDTNWVTVTDTLIIPTVITNSENSTFTKVYKAYPNPAKDVLYIRGNGEDETQVTLARLIAPSGEVVRIGKFSNEFDFDLKGLEKNQVYVLEIIDMLGIKLSSKKIIIQ